ncbi:MAG: CPBP family intramembrane glutamic endopeptidase [Sporomusaceae bacterium]|nr:CPBP family intramembrane glutamic endopeptidase [Sporomusaceae bacterium]
MNAGYVYKPFKYFSSVIIITWIIESGMVWLSCNRSEQRAYEELFSLMLFIALLTPCIVALLMIFLSGSRELTRDFLSRAFDLRRIKLNYLPMILFTMPALAAASIYLSAFMGESLEQFRIDKGVIFATGVIPAPFFLFAAPLSEELGWKGYGMDSLRSKYNFFTASLIFGLVWCLWHAPLFFVDNYYMNLLWRAGWLYVLNYFASAIAAGFLINWLWYKNRGCILVAVLVHASANLQGIFLMGNIAKCIETFLFVALAFFVVLADKKVFFGKPSGRIGHFIE